jgi:hypothetical protein
MGPIPGKATNLKSRDILPKMALWLHLWRYSHYCLYLTENQIIMTMEILLLVTWCYISHVTYREVVTT